MDQQSETNAPQQVIYIIQAPKEKVNIKDAYNIKAATALGIIHIICGFIALASDIAGMVTSHGAFATGIWTSILFFVSGGLAIGGARSGNKCLVVATMVMSIISAISAGILLIMSAISLEIFGHHYQPNQVPTSVLVNANQMAALNLPPLQDLQAHPSTSVQLLSDSAEPPTYQDVAGVGSNYQKF